MSHFKTECVSSYDFLSEEYRELFIASQATVFQNPNFLQEFYSNLAASLNVEPLIVLMRDASSNKLLLVMPFVRQKKFGVKMIQPADLGVADYNSVIGREEDLKRIAGCPLFQKELKKYLGSFDILLFRKQRPDTFDINDVIEGGKRGQNVNSAYHTVIEGDLAYWKGKTFSKKFQKAMARKMRGLERDFGPVEFKSLKTDEEIKKAFLFLKEQRATRYVDDLLQNDAYYNFYQEMALQGPETGYTLVFAGIQNNELLTVEFGFFSKSTYHFIMGTFNTDPRFKRHSLGLHSILKTIEYLKQQDIRVFDFALGDESYKQDFAAEETVMENTVFANSLIGHLARSAYLNDGFIKKAIKKLAPNLS